MYKKNGSAMIKVDAKYVKECIRNKNGSLERISEEMGYNTKYLSFCLSRNKQELLPIVLDYLVRNFDIDERKATMSERCVKKEVDMEQLSNKVEELSLKLAKLNNDMFTALRTFAEIKALIK